MARAELNPVFHGISGRIGNIVYYNYGSSQYMRRYIIPYNPKTDEQQSRRFLFADAVAAWQNLPYYKKKQWSHKAAHRHLAGYNYFISLYMRSNGAADINTEHQVCSSATASSDQHHYTVTASPFQPMFNTFVNLQVKYTVL